MIEQFKAGMDLAKYEADVKTAAAVERCLQRISEAASKLGSVAEEISPEVPWPKVRALGNLLRHEYDRIQALRVWLVVERELPPLKSAAEAALRRLS